MALVLKDRVRETSFTAGTGTITLSGAVAGFQSFSVIGNDNTTYYVIADSITGEWEVGIGTYTSSGTTLSRDTILESSNGGTAVDFAGNPKDVFCTYPAERSVYVDGSSIVPATASRLGFTNLAQGSALSVLGVTGNSASDVASIAAGTDNQVLRRSGTALAFGAVNLGSTDAVTGTLPVGNGGSGATTLTGVLKGNGTAAFTAGNVSLTSEVTGTLPVANGGTGITSLGTGVATFLGTPTSANLAAAVTDETGSGALVFATSPTLVTPNIGAATGTQLDIDNLRLDGNTLSSTNTNGNVELTPNGIGRVTTSALSATSPRVITAINDTNGNELIGVTATTSAVNEITVANAATTNSPAISATGGDTNIGLNITPKGTGRTTVTQLTTTSPRVLTSIDDTNGNELFGVTATTSAVNEFTVANAAAGNPPTLSATGNDTNIGIRLQPKGTGGVVFNAGAVGTPSITTTGDLNTGIYFPAADTIAFTEGGAEAMRIDSNGNVGIGTSSPAFRLQLGTTTSTSTATPETLSLGGTFSNTAGANAKLRVWTDASNVIGFGVSSNQLDYIASGAYSHVWYTNGSERMRIDSSGNVLVGITTARANAGDVQVSKGISFPATQSAQSDANTLDDYEEGTFTPTLVGTGGSIGSQAYTDQFGRYVKIGRFVFISGYLGLSNKGSWTGNVLLSNLPFTVANESRAFSAITFYNANLTLAANNFGAGAYPAPNTTHAVMFSNNNSGSSEMSYSQINNNSQIGAWTICYFTSA